jgi:hypothetical protein
MRIVLFIAVIALAGAAHADPRHNELSIGGNGRALRSSSANALTGDDLAGLSLGAARDLEISLLPDLTLWAEAGLLIGSADGVMFQSLSTQIDDVGLTGGLAARYRLHRLIAATARLGLGVQRASVSITDRTTSASDHGWGALASAGAALDLLTSSRPRFGVGVRFELGYIAAQGVDLTPRRAHPGDEIALAMTEVALGRLDLSGPSATVSLVGQF